MLSIFKTLLKFEYNCVLPSIPYIGYSQKSYYGHIFYTSIFYSSAEWGDASLICSLAYTMTRLIFIISTIIISTLYHIFHPAYVCKEKNKFAPGRFCLILLANIFCVLCMYCTSIVVYSIYEYVNCMWGGYIILSNMFKLFVGMILCQNLS